MDQLLTRAHVVIAWKVFDNNDFEVRSPEHWLSLARDANGNTAGLPARALFMHGNSCGSWRECKVIQSSHLPTDSQRLRALSKCEQCLLFLPKSPRSSIPVNKMIVYRYCVGDITGRMLVTNYHGYLSCG